MASFSGEIKLKGQTQGDFGTFKVTAFKYTAESHRDKASGQASGRAQGSVLEMELVMLPKTLMALGSLFRNETLDGEMTFNKIDQHSTYEKVKFEQAHCFYFEQSFHHMEAQPFTVALKLSVAKLEFECESISVANEFFYAAGSTG